MASPDRDGGETNLRCAKCDFKVIRFQDCLWEDSADYMLFRNFMPGAPAPVCTPKPELLRRACAEARAAELPDHLPSTDSLGAVHADRTKLLTRLRRNAEGHSAMACQCSWANVEVSRRQPPYDHWFPTQ